MITIIAAVAADGGIGKGGKLLWHLPEDLKHFKALTHDSTIIMGRNTWESLPKRPLPGRRNIIISSNKDYNADGAEVFPSLAEAIAATRDKTGIPGKGEESCEEEIFIIGGGMIYAEAIKFADFLELTEIDDIIADADTFFPSHNREEWNLVSSESHQEKGLTYRFNRYQRNV